LHALAAITGKAAADKNMRDENPACQIRGRGPRLGCWPGLSWLGLGKSVGSAAKRGQPALPPTEPAEPRNALCRHQIAFGLAVGARLAGKKLGQMAAECRSAAP